MNSRVLPASEWARLAGTEVESIVPGLEPSRTHVLVIEDGDQIVGTWALIMMPHLECFWIDQAHRGKAGVAAKLLRDMAHLIEVENVGCPLTASVTPEMTAMIGRLGGIKLPGEHFALPLRTSCQQ